MDRLIKITELQTSANGSSRISIRKEELNQILEKASGQKVSIISLTSTNALCKSNFLERLIKSLEYLEGNIPDNQHVGPTLTYDPSDPIESTGIWMWNKFFTLISNGESLAVFIVDVRGEVDYDGSFTDDYASLLGVSLLTSSCTLILSEENIGPAYWNILHSFVEYDAQVQHLLKRNNRKNTHRPSFHKLLFIVNNWIRESEFPFGFAGGKQYLRQQSKDGLNAVTQCFEELECFLFPSLLQISNAQSIGDSSLSNSKEINRMVQDLITSVISPDNIFVKSVLDNELQSNDVLGCFEKYHQLFCRSPEPDARILVDASIEISNQSLITKLQDQYRKEMNKKLARKKVVTNQYLDLANRNIKDGIVSEYKVTALLGDEDKWKSQEEDLIFELKGEFELFIKRNEEIKKEFLEATIEKAAISFHKSVEDELETEESFLLENDMANLTISVKDGVTKEFIDGLFDQTEEEKNSSLHQLTSRLNREETACFQMNSERKRNAEEQLEKLVQNFNVSHNQAVKLEFDRQPFMEDPQFTSIQEFQKANALSGFEKKTGNIQQQIISPYKQKLIKSIESDFDRMKTEHIEKAERICERVDEIVFQAVQKYKTNILPHTDDIFDHDELQKDHERLFESTVSSFCSTHPFPQHSDIFEKYLLKLKNEIKTVYRLIVKDLVEKSEKCENTYKQSVLDAYKYYTNAMDEMSRQGKCFSIEDFANNHEQKALEAMDLLKSITPAIIHPRPHTFTEDLGKQIHAHFQKAKEKFEEHILLAREKAKNVAGLSLRNYQSEMSKNISLARDENHLQELHDQAVFVAVNDFKLACLIQNPLFTKPFIFELQRDIDEIYNDDIKDYFRMKLRERELATQVATAEARRLYHDEMRKHFKNTEFMRLEALEEHHKRIIKQAILLSSEKAVLTVAQINDLKLALEATYEEEYKIPNLTNAPVDPAIGIDLGTTYTCVGVYARGRVTIIPNGHGNKTTPSYVCYSQEGLVECVGESAKSRAYENSENTIFDAKRILGRSFDDQKLQNDMKFWPFEVVNQSEVPKIKINNKLYFPEQISSEVLKSMKNTAEDYLGCTIKNAVITVPAYFNDGQKQATIDAGELAGLNVLQIITEPTAAAIAYKLQQTDETTRHALIFDLGGGTFDVAVLKIGKGSIEVLAVDGDTHLGGKDFDQNIMEYCAEEFKKTHAIDLMDGKDSDDSQQKHDVRKRLKRLQLECERKKVDLSSCPRVDISVDAIWYDQVSLSYDLKVELTRQKFEEINDDLFHLTMKIVERVLRSASLDKSQIADIILVGGSTRIPKVQELLRNFFDYKALNKSIDPDEAVAWGAAFKAATLNGQLATGSADFINVQDVIPKSLGVEVYGGDFCPMIPKNEKLPITITEQYRTAHDNQTAVQITIYQGEKTEAKSNEWLGEFYLNGVPPGKAGEETIDVTMEINAQGILHVTAVCTSTGDSKSTGNITCKEHKRRMGRDTIQRILDEGKAGRSPESRNDSSTAR